MILFLSHLFFFGQFLIGFSDFLDVESCQLLGDPIALMTEVSRSVSPRSIRKRSDPITVGGPPAMEENRAAVGAGMVPYGAHGELGMDLGSHDEWLYCH